MSTRRHDLNRMIPVEVNIYQIMIQVEDLGADRRLTEAQQHLDKAKNLIGDVVDDQLAKEAS